MTNSSSTEIACTCVHTRQAIFILYHQDQLCSSCVFTCCSSICTLLMLEIFSAYSAQSLPFCMETKTLCSGNMRSQIGMGRLPDCMEGSTSAVIQPAVHRIICDMLIFRRPCSGNMKKRKHAHIALHSEMAT